MPLEYTYVVNNGVHVKGVGIVTGRELSNLNREIYETPQKINAISYQLADFTEVTEFNASSDDIQNLAKQDKNAAKINPKMIIAVVGEDDLVFGLARMWDVYADESDFETSVFRTIKDARNWIESKLGINLL